MNKDINVNVSRTVNASIKYKGTTAERPDNGILPGFIYFDTTLGKPIWWNGKNWVDALGNSIDTEYQNIIDADNKLNADLITDGITNKTVTATEKSTWNNKQDAVTGTVGNFAGFDENGKLSDSGNKASDFQSVQNNNE